MFGIYSDSPKQASAAGGARHDVCEAGGWGRGGGDLGSSAHSASRSHSASTISTSVLSHRIVIMDFIVVNLYCISPLNFSCCKNGENLCLSNHFHRTYLDDICQHTINSAKFFICLFLFNPLPLQKALVVDVSTG